MQDSVLAIRITPSVDPSRVVWRLERSGRDALSLGYVSNAVRSLFLPLFTPVALSDPHLELSRSVRFHCRMVIILEPF